MFLLLPAMASAKDFARDFAVVFVDRATEARFGAFPFDRSLIAQAVERSANAGAKAVVLKFFLDQSRSPSGDDALATSMSSVPVVLQARIDDAEAAPNPLPERFFLSSPETRSSVQGNAGWIPRAQFSSLAADVCFVDFDSSPIPLVETYRHRPVKSLVLCAIERALGSEAVFTSPRAIRVGDCEIAVDAMHRTAVQSGLDRPVATFAFNDLVDGKLVSGQLKDKVVIIGYDGPNVPRIGGVGIHRRFVALLRGLYDSL